MYLIGQCWILIFPLSPFGCTGEELLCIIIVHKNIKVPRALLITLDLSGQKQSLQWEYTVYLERTTYLEERNILLKV